ncbi:MAG: hypothetical protein RLZZ546_840, partial [Bacteroidota bacterium]
MVEKIIIMGVSGCGKSTIGLRLAKEIDALFIEADDYHPLQNVNKMASGIPLSDEDRWPWLDSLCIAISEHRGSVVATCSALKESYRLYLK